MSELSDIRNAIKEMAKNQDEIYSILGTVSAIDENALTCDVVPLFEAPDLLDVKLMPLSADGEVKKGFLRIPKIGAVVIVTMLSADEGYIATESQLEKLYVNGENYGGLVMIMELVKKLNALENKVNSIISTFNTHTHPYVNIAAPATTSPSATPVTGSLTLTKKIDLENTTVVHGNGQ
jgi:hypothetical protein